MNQKAIKSSFLKIQREDSPVWCPRKMSIKNGVYQGKKIRSQNFANALDDLSKTIDRRDYNLFEIETLNFKLYYKTEMDNQEFIQKALDQAYITYFSLIKHFHLID